MTNENWANFEDKQCISDTEKNVTFKELFYSNFVKTLTYFSLFLSFGMCVAFLGPTILDLGCLTSSDMKSTSWVFMAQLLFSLIGASLAAYFVERFNVDKIIFLNSFFLPICMLFIPFSTNIYMLALILAIMGLNMGFIDCISNQQMVFIYGGSVAPFLHALHFCYGIGAFISPMIAEPYLLNEDCSIFIDNITSISIENDIQLSAIKLAYIKSGVLQINGTNFPASTLKEAQQIIKVKYAFWIMAIIQAPVALLAFLNMRINMKSYNKTKDFALNKENENRSFNSNSSNFCQNERIPFASYKTQIYVIIVLSGFLLFIYDGLQSSYAGYIYSYALKSIVDLDKTDGAYLNALFWGMFAFGRLLSIFLATQLTSSFMLFSSILGCVLSSSFMLILQHNHFVLYIGTSIYGLSLSSIAPSTISMAEKYIDITATRTSFLVVIAATGEMICPVIVGNIFVRLGPTSFLVFTSLMCFISLIIYCIIWIVGKTTPKHKASNPASSFIWRYKPYLKENTQQNNSHQPKIATSHGNLSNIELDKMT